MNSANAQLENGESIIPASQRPDGTWRKARRVKEGYVPQEEVPLYESKGKQFVNRTTKPQTVTLASGQVAYQSIPGLFIVPEKAKAKKKKTKNVENVSKQLEQVKLTDNVAVKPQTKSQSKSKAKSVAKVEEAPQADDKASNANNQDVDPVKRLRNLKKRLREVEQLEEKLANGLIAKPEPEQLAKVLRKSYLQMQIKELEKEV